MFIGEPRPGTEVVFVCEIRTPLRRTARAFDKARLVGITDLGRVPNPDDEIKVEFQGEHFVVRRRQIRSATNRFATE